MTSSPEWTHRHHEELRDHWWWRPGWKIGTRFYAWHITVDDQPGLHELAERYQAELATVPGLDLIPRDWLHLTMQGDGFVEDVPPEQVEAILAAARNRLGEIAAFEAHFGRPVVTAEAIILPPDPVEPFDQLRTAVRAAIGDALGPTAVPEEANGYRPHISLAYVNAQQPAANAIQAIERVTAGAARTSIRTVSLIEMHRDNRMYEWRTVEAVRLANR
ncbi:2'-5' RNA ligase family protein [Kribbella deserti]|uniref:2'-5' RNA ligase family protein n=1 Tax=Kribbella deserti TaxID=1926257 RepID=A0ABV6QUU8_9ACTN